MPPKPQKAAQASNEEAKATSKSSRSNGPKIALDECHDKLRAHGEGLNSFDARLQAMETHYANLNSDYKKLQEKTDDLENRGRRCNLRIIGVPEGLEKGNPTQFIAGLLHEVLGGPNGLEQPPILDRAHRATAKFPREGDRPRPFILRVHYFQEKERIQRLARQKGRPEFQGKQILIFPDYSANLSRRRAAFSEVKELQHKEEGVRYGLLYPAHLRISFNGQTKMFENPQAAKDFVMAKI
ncbi:LINE-1 retrotransposable element ORF1 protein [Dissostichus eleginoides]|uniref:LINE-1 retrotransposable element ORF1 protein n=1 Tax=Dissostichus eleginoides TaxID=100907 RepID=A0AAD9C3U3_DISEL|nr:LINE-1 retrotransposable element ORF1 protein [Dissostichus eleginoides]